jgi:DNA polymerase-4
MDAFYASVEQRDDPSLAGKPVIVGGHAKRGVVLAASYEVRPLGVRSAMPMARALKLAPKAVVVPPRFAAYVAASEKVFDIFESFTPLVEPLSLDEAFLDVSGSTSLFGAPAAIATKIRALIASEVGLPASAGIAAVKFVAKVASDFAKPNGQYEVAEPDTVAFLARLPIARLWGVGPKTEELLRAHALRTIGDIGAKDVRWLEDRFGELGRHLSELARGIDPREVVPDRDAKSMGAEDTFEEDIEGFEPLNPHVHSQALRIGRRLRKAGVKCRVVQLKVKLASFEVFTRRTTLDTSTDDGQALYREAVALLARIPAGQKVRLTGVSAQELTRGKAQLDLFAMAPLRSDKLNAALDRIVSKFGPGAITTADLAAEDTTDDEVRDGMGASRLDAAVARGKTKR